MSRLEFVQQRCLAGLPELLLEMGSRIRRSASSGRRSRQGRSQYHMGRIEPLCGRTLDSLPSSHNDPLGVFLELQTRGERLPQSAQTH